MKSFYDLPFNEKVAIQEGRADPLKYGTGYSFAVKAAVQNGVEQKEKKDAGRDDPKREPPPS
ncbi:MAG: hypothetical protein B7W98_03435 [Parcubacteria group bacterium 20-58-5]|nr:MAG: hypothetical protein B7W98_03435 [Parcubacteria group bacterium 20-58-5]